MKKLALLILPFLFAACPTTNPRPQYIAPSTYGVNQAVDNAHNSVNSAHKHTGDAKETIQAVIDENQALKQKLEQIRHARHE